MPTEEEYIYAKPEEPLAKTKKSHKKFIIIAITIIIILLLVYFIYNNGPFFNLNLTQTISNQNNQNPTQNEIKSNTTAFVNETQISLSIDIPKNSFKVGEYLNGNITLKDYSNKSADFILITNGKEGTDAKCYDEWCCGYSVTTDLVARDLSSCVNGRFTSTGVYTFEVNVYDCAQYHKVTGNICNPLAIPKNFQEWAANLSNQLTPIISKNVTVTVT